MQTTSAESQESTDVEQRDVRAITEYMTVLSEGGDIYTVVGQNENGEYAVDFREERCTCADHRYRGTRCKHIRRVAFATGERVIPAKVDADEIDPQIGEHVESAPKVAITDVLSTSKNLVSTIVTTYSAGPSFIYLTEQRYWQGPTEDSK